MAWGGGLPTVQGKPFDPLLDLLMSPNPRLLVSVAALALLGACGSIREARMVVPASLAGTAEESFGKVGWGRKGDFMLGSQRVQYERGADRLSLFETFSYGRAPLRIQLAGSAGERRAECAARQGELSSGGLAAPTKPWTLSCDWKGGAEADARLHIGEGRVQWAQQTRSGEYRRGDFLLSLRSVHQLEGSALATQQAVGYEILQQDRVVGSVDLSRGKPVLRRPDPATPLGQAVTEAALALALVWEPS